MPLNLPQQAFIREYLIDRNGTQAAIRAGYSAKTAYSQAERLLRHVEIRRAVDAGLNRIAEKTETDAEWVRRRLKEEAEFVGPGSSPSARVRAIELVGKLNANRCFAPERVVVPAVDRVADTLRELAEKLPV
jgi:hypothetical protein